MEKAVSTHAGDLSYKPSAGCQYGPTGSRLPSQPRDIANIRPVSNCANWWLRHIGVNTFPKINVQLCPAGSRTLNLLTANLTLCWLCHLATHKSYCTECRNYEHETEKHTNKSSHKPEAGRKLFANIFRQIVSNETMCISHVVTCTGNNTKAW